MDPNQYYDLLARDLRTIEQVSLNEWNKRFRKAIRRAEGLPVHLYVWYNFVAEFAH